MLALTLAMFSASVVAGNGNGNAQGHGNSGHGNGQGKGPDHVQNQAPGQAHGGGNRHQGDNYQGNDYRDHDRDDYRDHDRDHHDHDRDININLAHDDIRDIFHDHRDWVDGPREALPPGIRQNLARGKPLPPGIAKRVDSRFYDVLPRHDGYEWWVAGTTAILVNATNNIIEEVVEDVFY
ncbi:hypothetical protein BJB45_15595 [Halomonas huangheensis]|uniref:Integral membrane protein n=1 Tax=Halomonas huangheensis TaxID=1178482 RepID=W1NAW1_9GAMM|nr:hypothetical protein AR456_11070 [Halomonas huangheensis]ERL52702.1 hypothetical protein BJB45_15595 [Halomonas huangheensis]